MTFQVKIYRQYSHRTRTRSNEWRRIFRKWWHTQYIYKYISYVGGAILRSTVYYSCCYCSFLHPLSCIDFERSKMKTKYYKYRYILLNQCVFDRITWIVNVENEIKKSSINYKHFIVGRIKNVYKISYPMNNLDENLVTRWMCQLK